MTYIGFLGNVVRTITDQTIAGVKTFTSSPIVPTPTAGDNSTKVATTAYVDGKMVRATAVTATGTAIDFTGIPSWVKRITVMFDGVSTNGTSTPIIQIGDSGGIETTGYNSVASAMSSSVTSGTFTNCFPLAPATTAATNTINGVVQIVNLNLNTWCESGNLAYPNASSVLSAGSKTLSNTLDMVRITTANGTDTFDAGTINIMYEG